MVERKPKRQQAFAATGSKPGGKGRRGKKDNPPDGNETSQSAATATETLK